MLFSSNRTGTYKLFWKPITGGDAEQLTTGEHVQYPGSWSHDGKVMVFYDIDPETGWDIWELTMTGTRVQKPLLRSRFNELFATFSPDGRYLAYTSNRSGQDELYIQPYPVTREIWQISTAGAMDNPEWSPKGDELYYRNATGKKMMVVSIQTDPVFTASKPRVLFEGDFMVIAGESFDLSPDGKRFLMLKGTEGGTTRAQLNVVVNWFEELKRLVPGGK